MLSEIFPAAFLDLSSILDINKKPCSAVLLPLYGEHISTLSLDYMAKTEVQTNSNISCCIRKLHNYKFWSMTAAVTLAKYKKQRQKTPNQLSMSPMEQAVHRAKGHYGASMVNIAATT